MSSPFSDASIQARPKSAGGVLTPSSQSLNLSDGLGGKKRKRDGSSLEDLMKDSFAIKPYPPKGFVKPRTLQPLLLLPRSQLPLSYLDIASSSSPLPRSRLFETHVKILELEERMGNQPTVLIARLNDSHTLYAVEREDKGLYVILQLGSWVSLHQLKAAALVTQVDTTTNTSSKTSTSTFGAIGPDASKLPLITPESSKYTKKKRDAIQAIQSMVKRSCTPLATEAQSQPVEPKTEPESQDDAQNTIDTLPTEPTLPPTADEIFENTRNQYFEALYLSKASLAYFAKGPLSRARAAFHLDLDATLDMKDYVRFLESLVLSSKVMEKKYKDGVPTYVADADLRDLSADEAQAKSKKRKTSKKMKPGKNGLYPNEEIPLGKWWVGHDADSEGAPDMSKTAIAKSRISQLRIRETQLQLIVILEVLALQPLIAEEALPGMTKDTVLESKETPSKAKKLGNLATLIDLHIDRLCIWQSLSTDTFTAISDESGSTATSKLKNTDNILRDFCIEVITPFFAPRLPEQCDAINRKLGGPVAKSPAKPKLPKAASFSGRTSRPGAIAKRPVPPKPRQSLQSVLAEERERKRSMSVSSNRAISLMRSATIPGLKREGSEAPSLSSIPPAETKNVQANRGGVLNTKRFSQREVDMSVYAPDPNAKAKKQAAIEAELKEAINTLKKPNRELAGKSLVETAEKRSAGAVASHPRKLKKPIRNPLFQGAQGIQIKATPKATRQRDVFSRDNQYSMRQPTSAPSLSQGSEVDMIPPSSIPHIPDSIVRPREQNPFRNFVQATPTRKSSSGSKLDADIGAFPPSSPLQARRSSMQLFKSGTIYNDTVPDSVIKKPRTSGLGYMSEGVAETPVKMRRPASAGGRGGVMETPTRKSVARDSISPRENKENDTKRASLIGSPRKMSQGNTLGETDDIYKALGWDDDDFDDLA